VGRNRQLLFCVERGLLLDAFRIASAHYAQLTHDLIDTVNGTLQPGQQVTTFAEVTHARGVANHAKQALSDHKAAHKCGG
jgi:hypothetical protein